jgi:acylphosphatase
MKKCLKIALTNVSNEKFAHELQKKGAQLGVEGTLQFVAKGSLKIVVCGLKDQVDKFVDCVHTEVSKSERTDLNIEPFISARDYRGAFRLIE